MAPVWAGVLLGKYHYYYSSSLSSPMLISLYRFHHAKLREALTPCWCLASNTLYFLFIFCPFRLCIPQTCHPTFLLVEVIVDIPLQLSLWWMLSQRQKLAGMALPVVMKGSGEATQHTSIIINPCNEWPSDWQEPHHEWNLTSINETLVPLASLLGPR